MKNDLLVVFTKDVDKYNLKKQLRNFTESEIVEIDGYPRYEILSSMAEMAYENGYDSFHYLTESSDWAELDFEFKKEFSMFKEAGVIKGNYGRAKFTEADTRNPNEPLFVFFPANFARFDANEKIKIQFLNAIKSYANYEPKYLLLPAPQGSFTNKNAGLSAGEAFELFEDIVKSDIKKLFKPNNIRYIKLEDTSFLNGFGLTPQSSPRYLGPESWTKYYSAAIQNIKQNYSFTPERESSYFSEYSDNNALNRNSQFSNKLSEFINDLKANSINTPLDETDKAIINNISNEIKTEKQNYVNQCFNIAIYNITNNIDIQNNTQINVNIGQINVNNGLQILGSVTSNLLDINGNLEATKGTIYNSGIRALQYGARRMFTDKNKSYQAAADAKAALSKMTGGHINFDDSFETDYINKSNTLDSEIRNRSGANAKARQDARLSDLNIEDTKEKIELLQNKIEQIDSDIKSAQGKEKSELQSSKKEIEQELINAKAQLSAYNQHKIHNQKFGDIEKIKQIQHDRDNSASGLNGAKNNPYSNMGNVDDKTKVQKAKNISQAQELNQKMEAQLLKGKAGQRKLDELVAALPS